MKSEITPRRLRPGVVFLLLLAVVACVPFLRETPTERMLRIWCQQQKATGSSPDTVSWRGIISLESREWGDWTFSYRLQRVPGRLDLQLRSLWGVEAGRIRVADSLYWETAWPLPETPFPAVLPFTASRLWELFWGLPFCETEVLAKGRVRLFPGTSPLVVRVQGPREYPLEVVKLGSKNDDFPWELKYQWKNWPEDRTFPARLEVSNRREGWRLVCTIKNIKVNGENLGDHPRIQ